MTYGDDGCVCVVLGLLAALLLVNPFSPLLRIELRLEGTSKRPSPPTHQPPVGISPVTVAPLLPWWGDGAPAGSSKPPPSRGEPSAGWSSGMAAIRVWLVLGVVYGGRLPGEVCPCEEELPKGDDTGGSPPWLVDGRLTPLASAEGIQMGGGGCGGPPTEAW